MEAKEGQATVGDLDIKCGHEPCEVFDEECVGGGPAKRT